MTAINITAYTEDDSQIEAIISMFKAFKIKYEISEISEVSESETPYKKEFVKMIKQGEKEIKEGKGIKISIDDLENLCK